MPSTRTMLAASLASATMAVAQPVTLDVTNASIAVTVTIDTPLIGDSDSSTSTISGTIDIELDDYENPTSMIIHDFSLELDQNPFFQFFFGMFGTATTSLVDAVAMYDTPGTPTGPEPLAGSNFNFGAVATALTGTANVAYDILLVGDGNETVDLADNPAVDAPASGTVTSAGGVVTLDGTLSFESTDEIAEGLTVTIAGTVTLSATGKIATCAADLVPPAGLDIFDIIEYLARFDAMDPSADLAPPTGDFDIFDIIEYLARFDAGCP